MSFAVTLANQHPHGERMVATLRQLLSQSGYQVIDSDPDLVVRVTVATKEEPQEAFIKSSTGQVLVVLAEVLRDQAVVERHAVVLPEPASKPHIALERKELQKVVDTMDKSKPIRAYAERNVRTKRRDGTTASNGPGEGKAGSNKSKPTSKSARERDELAWIEARALACRHPVSLDACDAVRAYLAKYPDGAHADEGRSIVEEAAPKLEKLQLDDNEWKRAGHIACEQLRTDDACAGVVVYTVKYPGGLHFDEAQLLLSKRKTSGGATQ